jgi:uncharacterized protein YneF (UPF0154 family)
MRAIVAVLFLAVALFIGLAFISIEQMQDRLNTHAAVITALAEKVKE